MRKIKFRAWDKDTEKMLYTSFSLYGNGTWLHLWGYDPQFNTGFIVKEMHPDEWHKRFELMQYTGLKDKNGEEIFEGDIVKYRGSKLEVRYDLDSASFVMGTPNFKSSLKFVSQFTVGLEVIGNIYENPNLLK